MNRLEREVVSHACHLVSKGTEADSSARVWTCGQLVVEELQMLFIIPFLFIPA